MNHIDINARDIHVMSPEKHFTVCIVLLDLIPDVPYIPGSAYDRRKVTEHDIEMPEDFVVLPTSSQDLPRLCDHFVGNWSQVLLPEHLIAPFFDLVVRTAVDDHLPEAIKTRVPIFCAELVLLPGTQPRQPRTLWHKNSRLTDDPSSDPMNVETFVRVYSGDVIEIRAVQQSRPFCMSCLSKQATRVLDPCGHFGMCRECCQNWETVCKESSKTFNCPMCRMEIKAYIPISTAVKEQKIDVKVCTKVPMESLLQQFRYI